MKIHLDNKKQDDREILFDAVAERFFKTLKQKFIYPKKFRSVADFKTQLAGYIDYYNIERRHLSNGNKNTAGDRTKLLCGVSGE